MSRLRTLFAALVLVLALAASMPAPSEAAGSRRSDPGGDPRPSLTDFVPQWIVSLFERMGLHVDPNGSGSTVTTDGEGGDTGWHIDPNG